MVGFARRGRAGADGEVHLGARLCLLPRRGVLGGHLALGHLLARGLLAPAGLQPYLFELLLGLGEREAYQVGRFHGPRAATDGQGDARAPLDLLARGDRLLEHPALVFLAARPPLDGDPEALLREAIPRLLLGEPHHVGHLPLPDAQGSLGFLRSLPEGAHHRSVEAPRRPQARKAEHGEQHDEGGRQEPRPPPPPPPPPGGPHETAGSPAGVPGDGSQR